MNKQKNLIKKFTSSNLWFTVLTAISITLILIILSQPGPQASIGDLLGFNLPDSTFKPEPIDYSKLQKVKISRVIDGDTAILEDARRIRYLNIDTPESVKPNTTVKCYGKEAYEMNKKLVENQEVWIKFDKEEEDRYGRLLVFVFLQGKNANDITQSVNAYLVQTGFARSYVVKPNNTFAQEFAGMELEAKNKNIGLWQVCTKPFEE